MKYTIDVTLRHIRCGTPGECNICPIALAIQEAIPGCRVDVFGPVAFLNGKAINLPAACSTFVARLDRGYPVNPFSFPLDTSDIAKDWRWY